MAKRRRIDKQKVDKAPHRYLTIEQDESHYKTGETRNGKHFLLNHGTCRLALVKNLVNSHERGKKYGIMTTTNGTHPWSSVRQIFRNG